MVKRCVALPGDEVEFLSRKISLSMATRVDDASYTWHRDSRIFEDLPMVPESARRRDNFGPYVVPARSLLLSRRQS